MPRTVTLVCGDFGRLVSDDVDATCKQIAEDAFNLETRPMRTMEDALCMELVTGGPERLQKIVAARVVHHLRRIASDRLGFEMGFAAGMHSSSTDFGGARVKFHWIPEQLQSLPPEQKEKVTCDITRCREDAAVCTLSLDFEGRKIGWSVNLSPWGVAR